jgi:hypothetical protein
MSGGIDDDYKWALGRLVMEVSNLDSALTQLIAALTEMKITYALILVHHQQFSSKIDALRALFRLVYPSEHDAQYQPVKDVLDRVKVVGDFRNSVVHALWEVDEAGTPHVVRFRARGELTHSRQPAPIEKVRDHTLEAIQLAGALSNLAKVYRGYAALGE